MRISHILTFNPLVSASAHNFIKSALKVSHLQSLQPQIYPCYISHSLAQNHLLERWQSWIEEYKVVDALGARQVAMTVSNNIPPIR